MSRFNATPLSKDKVIVRIAGITIIALFFVAAGLYDPFESDLLSCQFKNLTGYDCPTCGLSRSIYCLMSFRFLDSLKYNPLGPVIFIGLVMLFIKLGIELLSGKEFRIIKKNSFRRIHLISLLLILVVLYILRLLFK